MKLISLWSGGLDSTIATYYYSLQHIIQPYHILIRNGGGKDAREINAVDHIYNELKDKFPNVLPVKRFKYKISPCENRNEQLINIVKQTLCNNIHDYAGIILGTYEIVDNTSTINLVDDNNRELLYKKTQIPIYALSLEGHDTKEKIFQLGLQIFNNNMNLLEKTWSCQLWWKSPCGKCYSCKERAELFTKYKKE